MSKSGDDTAGENVVNNNPVEDEETVATYTTMFSHRYTDQDEEFVKTRDKPLSDPPCVQNWFQRPKRNFDFTRGGRGRGGGGWNDNRGRHGGRDNWDRGYGGQHHNRNNRVHYAGSQGNRQQERYHPYQEGHQHR